MSLLDGHDLPHMLFGVLPTCNGLIALLPGMLAGGPLGRQFILNRLDGLLIGLSLTLGTASSVIFGQTLVGQLRLEIADRAGLSLR